MSKPKPDSKAPDTQTGGGTIKEGFDVQGGPKLGYGAPSGAKKGYDTPAGPKMGYGTKGGKKK